MNYAIIPYSIVKNVIYHILIKSSFANPVIMAFTLIIHNASLVVLQIALAATIINLIYFATNAKKECSMIIINKNVNFVMQLSLGAVAVIHMVKTIFTVMNVKMEANITNLLKNASVAIQLTKDVVIVLNIILE